MLPGAGGAVALEAGATYLLSFWLVPRPGPSFWVISAQDPGPWSHASLVGTNEGETPGLEPLGRPDLTVYAPRRPPTAIINVTLNVRTLSPGALDGALVILPPGFEFQGQLA